MLGLCLGVSWLLMRVYLPSQMANYSRCHSQRCVVDSCKTMFRADDTLTMSHAQCARNYVFDPEVCEVCDPVLDALFTGERGSADWRKNK